MEPLRELGLSIVRHTGASRRSQWLGDSLGLKLVTETRPAAPAPRMYQPVFALVVQGKKEIVLGDQVFTCGKGTFMVVSVDLPITFQVTRATPSEPYLALTLSLKPAAIAALLLEAGEDTSRAPEDHDAVGMGVAQAGADLLEATARLVRLLDHPRDLPVLGPMFEKEIMWRLLHSEQGHRLREICMADSRLSQIGRAIRFMREHYAERVTIEALARISAMSTTSFHRHFRAVARMSPLQYLQQTRLQEARTRLLAGAEDVALVGNAVGYESPSQFSREYKRAFGEPPGRDARLLRGANPGRTRAHASK